MVKARAIALYLPQYHPIPENDLWWGKGFTEWTNTAKAKPLFANHYQPHIPADLGFYDLRVPETRVQQADMARAYGIEGFCYYHYWFAGRRILERVFNEVLASGSPDFPFCLCWANESWSGIWHGSPDELLIEQTYPGEADHRAHFAALLPAFRDPRYIRVDDKPVFVIYKGSKIPGVAQTLLFWRRMASDAGLPGLHIVANTTEPNEDPTSLGYDAVIRGPNIKIKRWIRGWGHPRARLKQIWHSRRNHPAIYDFSEIVQDLHSVRSAGLVYPCVVHAWDNTPRSGRRGIAYINSDPAIFQRVLSASLDYVSMYPEDRRLIFLKSWNEWAEGNHLEPDLRHGTVYLEVLAKTLE